MLHFRHAPPFPLFCLSNARSTPLRAVSLLKFSSTVANATASFHASLPEEALLSTPWNRRFSFRLNSLLLQRVDRHTRAATADEADFSGCRCQMCATAKRESGNEWRTSWINLIEPLKSVAWALRCARANEHCADRQPRGVGRGGAWMPLVERARKGKAGPRVSVRPNFAELRLILWTTRNRRLREI